MRTIIRIEHKRGKGIWRTYKNNDSLITVCDFYWKLVDRHDKFPIPEEDNIKRTKKHYCAFKTIKQMLKWVTKEEIISFVNLGFKIFSIKVSECLVGEYQICFKKEHILEKTDITELFL